MKNERPQENPLLNLLINIILPVFVLNKLGAHLDPKITLVVALSFPLIYGVQDYVRRRHKNYVSLLGIVNIFLTGGLALMKLEGHWFAMKEAALPLVLGIFVFGSRWTTNPAAKMIFCNPQVLNMDLIGQKIDEHGRQLDFRSLLQRTTLWLSLSFLISAILNFVIATRIFVAIEPSLTAAAREQVLNEQIARMTWMGFAVIALPLMFFSGALVFLFLKQLSKLTDVPVNNLLKS